MDYRSEASPWAIRDLTEDIFGVSPASCAESSWEEAPDARVPGSCLDVLLDGRHRTPSPSIACIDPRLTVLWPSPPASPSEEESSASVDDGWTAFDDWDQELPDARVPECVLEGTTTRTLDAEGGGSDDESNTGPGKALPIRERELRKTRSTVTTRATAAAARNAKAMVKGPDKTHTKWKCRTKGDVGAAAPPSGPSSARISQMGRRPDPEPIRVNNSSSRSSSTSSGSSSSSKGESWQAAEGIEKIHMKLWKCRIGGCNKTFHRKGDAVRHLQTTARHNGKAVVCNCGAPFSRHDALKRHQRLCNGHTS